MPVKALDQRFDDQECWVPSLLSARTNTELRAGSSIASGSVSRFMDILQHQVARLALADIAFPRRPGSLAEGSTLLLAAGDATAYPSAYGPHVTAVRLQPCTNRPSSGSHQPNSILVPGLSVRVRQGHPDAEDGQVVSCIHGSLCATVDSFLSACLSERLQ